MGCARSTSKGCLAYREYLVTSPAENCERPWEQPVVRVRSRVSLFAYLTRDGRIPWTPLPYAFAHAGCVAGSDELLPGPEQPARLLGAGDRPMEDRSTGAVADCPV